MAIVPPTDAPPPSPVTDPAAAQETGLPPNAVAGLVQGGMAMTPQGPNLSGILTLGQKLEEGLLTLAQAVPLIAPDLEMCRATLMNALGRFAAQAGSPASGQPQPTGTAVTQAGSQFPGAQGGGRPF